MSKRSGRKRKLTSNINSNEIASCSKAAVRAGRDDDIIDLSMESLTETMKTVDNPKEATCSDILEEEVPRHDENSKQEKQRRNIEFHVISNSLSKPVSPQIKLWLLGVKNIVTKQLPRISVKDVTQFVFDPNNRTLALIHDNEPIGGITFRLFPARGFSEIAFCVVLSSQQYKGYGAHLLNHLKDYHIQHNILHILIHADKLAVSYFEKQGFTRAIKLPLSMYKGYIKVYEGATLMHCEIDPRIIYTEASAVVRKQKKIGKQIIRKKQQSKVTPIQPGLTCFKGGSGPIPIESIPGISETSWKHAAEEYDVDTLFTMLNKILKRVKKNYYAWPFQQPVDAAIAPDYYEVIRFPMDLSTIADRMKARYYVTRRLFIADMMRIFTNCCTYNQVETVYYECAIHLKQYFQDLMDDVGLWPRE